MIQHYDYFLENNSQYLLYHQVLNVLFINHIKKKKESKLQGLVERRLEKDTLKWIFYFLFHSFLYCWNILPQPILKTKAKNVWHQSIVCYGNHKKDNAKEESEVGYAWVLINTSYMLTKQYLFRYIKLKE